MSTDEQEILLAELVGSVRARGAGALADRLLDARTRLSASLIDELTQEDATLREGPSVIVIVGGFELADYVRGLRTFVESLDLDALATWHRCFTRAIYLAGNPARALARTRLPAIVSPSGSVAWSGPWLPARAKGVTQLLLALRTRAAPTLPDLVDGEASGEVEILIDRSRMPSLESYLVSLGHTIADGYRQGLLQRETRLRIRHVDSLIPLPPDRLDTRVSIDPLDAGRLAALTCVRRPGHPTTKGA